MTEIPATAMQRIPVDSTTRCCCATSTATTPTAAMLMLHATISSAVIQLKACRTGGDAGTSTR